MYFHHNVQKMSSETKDKVGEWLVQDTDKLRLKNKEHKEWRWAHKLIEAILPMAAQLKEVTISEIDTIRVFLYLIIEAGETPQTSSVIVSIVPVGSDGKMGTPSRQIQDQEQARDLVASFFCDFPDAVVSTVSDSPEKSGVPLRLLNHHDRNAKRHVTLNNLLECIERQHYKLGIAV